MNADKLEEALTWSEWLDFDKATIETVPESPGLYKMHANMKILYIGSSSQNIKKSLIECLSDTCISKAKRFSYALTASSDKVKEQLLNEYRARHNKFPECMQED
jgi:excinuclease UvrABC nuclease subunit